MLETGVKHDLGTPTRGRLEAAGVNDIASPIDGVHRRRFILLQDRHGTAGATLDRRRHRPHGAGKRALLTRANHEMLAGYGRGMFGRRHERRRDISNIDVVAQVVARPKQDQRFTRERAAHELVQDAPVEGARARARAVDVGQPQRDAQHMSGARRARKLVFSRQLMRVVDRHGLVGHAFINRLERRQAHLRDGAGVHDDGFRSLVANDVNQLLHGAHVHAPVVVGIRLGLRNAGLRREVKHHADPLRGLAQQVHRRDVAVKVANAFPDLSGAAGEHPDLVTLPRQNVNQRRSNVARSACDQDRRHY